jgi:hypothetical protein
MTRERIQQRIQLFDAKVLLLGLTFRKLSGYTRFPSAVPCKVCVPKGYGPADYEHNDVLAQSQFNRFRFWRRLRRILV